MGTTEINASIIIMGNIIIGNIKKMGITNAKCDMIMADYPIVGKITIKTGRKDNRIPLPHQTLASLDGIIKNNRIRDISKENAKFPTIQ